MNGLRMAALALVILGTARGATNGQESAARSYALGGVERPATIAVRVAYATIEVTGADRDDVLLQVTPIVPEGASPTDAAILAGTSFVSPVVDGNLMRIDSPDNTQPLRLELQVPRAVNLELQSSNGGRITVRDVEGALSIENSNAGVTFERVAGSALVATSNGSIVGEFVSLTPGAPMSFATSNGAIDVTFPPDLRADLLLETDNDGFTSDFPVDAGEQGAGEPLPRGRRRFTGRVNGGGPLLRMQTENAPIFLRRGGGH